MIEHLYNISDLREELEEQGLKEIEKHIINEFLNRVELQEGTR